MGKLRILSHSLFGACIIVKESYTKIQIIMIGANSPASSFRKSIFLRRHRSSRSLEATGRIPVYESIH